MPATHSFRYHAPRSSYIRVSIGSRRRNSRTSVVAVVVDCAPISSPRVSVYGVFCCWLGWRAQGGPGLAQVLKLGAPWGRYAPKGPAAGRNLRSAAAELSSDTRSRSGRSADLPPCTGSGRVHSPDASVTPQNKMCSDGNPRGCLLSND